MPRVDPFSFTAGGAAWLDHEWLFQVLLYLGHTSLGPAALCLMKVGAVLLLGWMMAVYPRVYSAFAAHIWGTVQQLVPHGG